MASNEVEPVRVMVWMVPRTLSTVFLKSMSNLDRVKIISEPFTCASAFGPERLLKGAAEGFVDTVSDISSKAEMDMGLDHNLYTYKWVKESLLEGTYPGKVAVVCKDTAMSIPRDKYNMIPRGYRHAFMIRHPNKLFKSWNKMFAAMMPHLGEGFLFSEMLKASGAEGYGFKELFDLYEYVKKSGLERNPIIIDSDDLLMDPEGILRKFCKSSGLQYTDKLLKFEAGDGVVKQWAASKVQLQANKAVYGVYQAAFDSTCFKKPTNMDPPPRSEFSEDLLECIDVSMPYYEKLYADRLTV
ncbi:uncharacterized protein [Antedon mediterranea]|uniref:uncharacterized protein n=1 Tax=Antedon mediterranea TaxID=105859 RepID=UPI003AF779A5